MPKHRICKDTFHWASTKGFQQRMGGTGLTFIMIIQSGFNVKSVVTEEGVENMNWTQIPISLGRLSIQAISWPAKAGDGWLVLEFREGYLYAFFSLGICIKNVCSLFDMEIWKQHWGKCFWKVIWHSIRDKKHLKIKFCLLTQKVGEERRFL